MPRPIDPHKSTAFGPKAARDRFTNRVDETRRFLELLNAPPGSPLPALMFYGVGGAGKTTLLRHLQSRCADYRVPWAESNLAEAGQFEQVLPRLAGDLRRRFGVPFPNFERALLLLTAREVGDVALAALGQSLGSPSKVVDRALGQVGTVFDLKHVGLIPDLLEGSLAVLDQLVPMVKLGRKLAQTAWNQAMKLEGFRNGMLRLGGQESLLDLLDLSADQLRLELQRCFAADLADGLPERPGPGGRGVLFFDNHDALWRDGKGGAGSQDGWLRHLCELLHDQGVLVVLAGRDSLRWGEDWAETDALGRRVWLEEHRVGGLSRRDALEFLRRADTPGDPDEPLGIPVDLQEAILEVTDENIVPDAASSHHCYLLTLCAEILANTKASTDAYPEPALFRLEGGNTAQALLARFLSSLPSQSMVGWLEELSLTPRFDEDFALGLDDARHHHNGRAGFARLRELSVLEEHDGFLEMHRLLREALRSRVAPEPGALIHAWAHAHWRARGEDDWAARGLAWYHQRFIDRRRALDEFSALCSEATRRANIPGLRRLLEWWRDVPLSQKPETRPEAHDLVRYAITLYNLPTGNRASSLSRVIDCYDAALLVYTEETAPENWATVQNNLAIAYKELPIGDRASNLERAIGCFEASMRVYTEESAPESWAHLQNNIGATCFDLPGPDRSRNLERAIGHFEAALRVFTETQHPEDWAMVEHNLGGVFGVLPGPDREANLRRAVTHFEAALRVRSEADDPANWAETQLEYGQVLLRFSLDASASTEKAISCFEAALRVFTEDDFPEFWADLQSGFARAYLRQDTDPSAATRAIEFCRAAMRVYTETEFPALWASVQQHLAEAFERLGQAPRALEAFAASARGYRAVGMEDAARAAENALEALSRDSS